MNVFTQLEKQYLSIDSMYASKEFLARSRGWHRKEAEFQKKRETNDQAYFLFMFTRLEDRIKDLSNTLIINKKNSIGSWRQRAAWDTLPTGSNSRINFKSRLALLTDRNGGDFTLVTMYYVERNSIAHGGNFTSPISMPNAIADFKRLYRDLKL